MHIRIQQKKISYISFLLFLFFEQRRYHIFGNTWGNRQEKCDIISLYFYYLNIAIYLNIIFSPCILNRECKMYNLNFKLYFNLI